MALISFLLSWGVRKGTQENKFQEKKILHKSHELDMRKMKTWHNFKQLMKCEKNLIIPLQQRMGHWYWTIMAGNELLAHYEYIAQQSVDTVI